MANIGLYKPAARQRGSGFHQHRGRGIDSGDTRRGPALLEQRRAVARPAAQIDDIGDLVKRNAGKEF
ncbi:hypothetical protein D3C76_1707470 [compost metagenome]